MGNKKITSSEIKNRIEKRFGKDAFSFNESEFENTITKMHFTCNKCGNVVLKEPSSFLRTSGCLVCNPPRPHRITLDELISRFKKTHENKYDYHLITEYKGIDEKYPIICPKHGVFEQSAYAHIHGEGCPYCAGEKRRTNICGFGINDYDGFIKENGKLIPSYATWVGMIKRCYENRKGKKNHTYDDCDVCDEWKYFSNFKKWFDDPSNGYIEGYQLDKDLLVDGNRVYSPEACCFIPNLINCQIKKYEVKKLGCSAGVYYREKDGKYLASHAFNGKQKFLGVFDTLQDAQKAYQFSKEYCIKSAAEEMYKNKKITKRVYDALMEYKTTS